MLDLISHFICFLFYPTFLYESSKELNCYSSFSPYSFPPPRNKEHHCCGKANHGVDLDAARSAFEHLADKHIILQIVSTQISFIADSPFSSEYWPLSRVLSYFVQILCAACNAWLGN